MKNKIFAILSVLSSIVTMAGCGTAKTVDPQQAYEDSISHVVAQTLLQHKEFVLTADRITLGPSGMIYVSDNLNFIMVEGEECTIQLALNYGLFYPFTFKGTITNYEYKETKKGEANVSFNFNGRLGSGDVSINLYRDSDLAVGYINSTFRRGRASFYGPIRSTSRTIIELPKQQTQGAD